MKSNPDKSGFDAKDLQGRSIKKRMDEIHPLFFRRAMLILAILGTSVLVFYALIFFRPKPQKKQRRESARTVKVIPVRKERIRVTYTGYGTVRPYDNAVIASQVKGNVVECCSGFKDGRLVRKGELLLKIDPSDYRSELKAAKSELKNLDADLRRLKSLLENDRKRLDVLKTDLELAKKDKERVNGLFEKNAVSESTLDKAMQVVAAKENVYISLKSALEQYPLQIESTNARMEMAEARREQAELNLDRCFIKAPFDGRLGDVSVSRGQFVNVGTKLITLHDDSRLLVLVPVDGAVIAKLGLRPDDEYENWFGDSEKLEATVQWVESQEACRWKARVERVAEYNDATRCAVLELIPTERIDSDCESPLVAGMFCRAEISGRYLENAVKIPRSAIQFGGNLYIVGENNTMYTKKVEPTYRAREYLAVTNEFKNGEYIVVDRIPFKRVRAMKVKPEIVDPGFGDGASAEEN